MKIKWLFCLVLLLSIAGCTGINDAPNPTEELKNSENPEKTVYIAETPEPKNSYTLVYSASPAYGGTILGPTTEIVEEGSMTKEVRAVPNKGFSFSCWSDGVTTEIRDSVPAKSDVNVYAIFSLNPSVSKLSINTFDGSGVTTKEEYKSATATLITAAEYYCFENLSLGIEGHGNSTWTYFKNIKPSFDIKFDKKINLLGLGKGAAKKYVLLADYDDRTALRSWIASSLGNSFSNIGYSFDCTWVSLYLNDEYMGLYILAEKVEVGDNRVDIDDSGSDTDIGYLLELDKRATDKRYNTDPYFKVTDAGKYVVIKSDIQNDAQKEYISTYVNEFYRACVSGKKEIVERYADIDSIVDMFILEEFAKEADQGFASFYFIKEKGGKIKFTCPWDFNLTFGNTYVYSSYEEFVSWNSTDEVNGASNIWFYQLFKCDWFKSMVSKRLDELKDEINDVINKIPQLASNIAPYAAENEAKLSTYGRHVFMEPSAIANLKSYDEHINSLVSWMKSRLAYMTRYFEKY